MNRYWMVLAGMSLSGCATLHMVPPADVAEQSDVLEAKDRSLFRGMFADESFDLGPYKVAEVDRDWTQSDYSTTFGFANNEVQTAFAFVFREQTEKLAAQCGSSTTWKHFDLGSSKFFGSEKSRLVCTCGSGDSIAKINIKHEGDAPKGFVSLGQRTFDVSTVYETNAASWAQNEPAGFRVDEGGKPVGAVEILHPGRIWLAKDLGSEERRQLGCLMTGVMLYSEPDEEDHDR